MSLRKSFLFAVLMMGCQTPPPAAAPVEVVKQQERERAEDLDCGTLSAHITESCCKGQDEPCLTCQSRQKVYTTVYREKCHSPEQKAEAVLVKDPFQNLAEADCAQLRDASTRMCCQAMLDSCKQCADKVAEAQRRFRDKECR